MASIQKHNMQEARAYSYGDVRDLVSRTLATLDGVAALPLTSDCTLQVLAEGLVLECRLVARSGVALYSLGRKAQAAVEEAVQQATGRPVLAVTILIDDIESADSIMVGRT